MPADSSATRIRPSAGAATRSERITVAAIFGLALLLRLLNLQQIRQHDPYFAQPSVDPRAYHEWALALSAGDWIGSEVFFLGPLYPYLLGLVYAAFEPGFLAPKLLHCLLGAATCVLVWALARRVLDRRVAVLASAMTAVYGMLIFYGGSLLIANLLTPLLLVLLLCLVRAFETPSIGRWLVAGAALGLSALARQTALLAAPLLALWLVWDLRDRAPALRRLALAAAFAAGALAVVLPATLRNYAVSGDWVLINSSGGNAFITANHEGATGGFHLPSEIPRSLADDPREQRATLKRIAEERSERTLLPSEVSSFWLDEGLAWIRQNPGDFASLATKRLGLWVNAYEGWTNRSFTVSKQFSWVLRLPLLSFGFVASLALLGLALTRHEARRLTPLYVLLGVHFAASTFFIVLARYRAPLVPVLIIFAAAALVWLFDTARARRTAALAAAAAGLAVATWIVHLDLTREKLSMAYFNLGNKYRALEQWDLSIEQYWLAIERDPGYIPSYNNLALSYESTGQHRREAVLAWREVHKMGRVQAVPLYIERAGRHLRALEPAPEK